MRYGIHFMDFNTPGGSAALAPAIVGTAEAAEQAGASWFTVMDHYFQMEQFRTSFDPMLEGYTTLGFVAGKTSTMKLGTIVTGVTYRHPGLLSKIVTTLDVLSQGRAFLGIGAAWYEREHLALGVPYPPMKERFERLEEAVRIALQMWSDNDGAFEGKHYQLAETISVPAPVQQPHPPVIIGGNGEQKTLRMVAEYADGCNFTVSDPEQVAHKLAVLRQHCDTLGRDFATIEKTVQGAMFDPVAESDRALRHAEALAKLGVEHLHYRAITPDPVGWARQFGETLAPRLAEIPIG